MRRHHALLSTLAAGVAALLLGACSTVQPDAITVNGEGLERSAFEDRLAAYAHNDAYVVQQSLQQLAVVGGGGDSVTVDFARSELQAAVLYMIAGQELRARGLAVDDESRSLGRELVGQTYGDALGGFSEAFVRDRVEDTARLLALAANLAGAESLAAAKQTLVDADAAAGNVRYGLRCLSHILSEDEAGADAVLAELAAGADFGDVAQERSTDPSAATNHGELGCYPLEDQSLDAAFLDGAFNAEVGVPATVITQFGVHVVLVTSIEPRTADEAAAVVLSDLLGVIGPPLTDFIAGARDDAAVSVDARYGRWDPALGIVDGEAASYVAPSSPLPLG